MNRRSFVQSVLAALGVGAAAKVATMPSVLTADPRRRIFRSGVVLGGDPPLPHRPSFTRVRFDDSEWMYIVDSPFFPVQEGDRVGAAWMRNEYVIIAARCGDWWIEPLTYNAAHA